MNIQNLFPLPVGFARLGRDLTKTELDFILGQERYANEGNTTSADRKILVGKELTDIRDFIEDAVLEYFKTVHDPKGDVSLYITQSWSNYTEPGQWHHKHAHPNSFVSGVFYLNTNPDDRIYFYRSGWQQIKFPPENWNSYNSESWWFEAITGRLILFPSSLEHNVPTVQGDDVRISMSFNTFPVGVVGDELSLTGLKLEA